MIKILLFLFKAVNVKRNEKGKKVAEVEPFLTVYIKILI